MVMLRANFPDLDLADALPFIHHLIDDEYDRYESMVSYLFNVVSSDRAIEQTTQITGFGLATETPEGGSVVYDDYYQGYDTTYTHSKFTKGFKFTEELIDDNKWQLAQRAARNIGESMAETREISAAQVFNRAFDGTYTGPDGVELCSLLHPLIGGGTEQNELTAAADLSVTSLRQAINTMEDTVNHRGLKINLRPKYLVVPNELQWDADELIMSQLRPDNAENAINAFRSAQTRLTPLVWQYLTDPDAWFMVCEASKHEMYWFDRKLPETSSEVDFDSGTAKTKMVSRWSRGFSNWPGIFGSPGA
jgi:hypothetical protein